MLYVENDVPPDREALLPDLAGEIRARCAREVESGIAQLVEQAPPRAPTGRARRGGRDPSLYLGLLGQAFGLLHIHERTGASSQLDLAARYLDAAFEAMGRSGYPLPEEWLSFHATGGLSAVAAVIQAQLGDAAASARHLSSYAKLAGVAADPDYPSEDLLWGRGGFLFGAAFVRARLGAESISDDCALGAMRAMIETGRRQARAHAEHLLPGRHGRPPLVYLNLNAFMMACFAQSILGYRGDWARALSRLAGRAVVAASGRKQRLDWRYDCGVVHGLLGNAYLLMQFPDLLERGAGWRDDVRRALDCLTECVSAEHGLRELLPSPRSDDLNARAGTGAFTDRVHWCNGSAGAVFVFARAYSLFGDEAYLDAAKRAADHVWAHGLLRKGNGICHGVAGNGYAFLALHRATSDERQLQRALHFANASWSERVTRAQRQADRPWSLYEGRLGTLCFYQDCLDPERARFPAFEV